MYSIQPDRFMDKDFFWTTGSVSIYLLANRISDPVIIINTEMSKQVIL